MSAGGCRTEVVIYVDVRVSATVRLSFANCVDLDPDVAGAMRVRLEVDHVSGGYARGVFGSARVLADATISDG